jgi:hypothetical protein
MNYFHHVDSAIVILTLSHWCWLPPQSHLLSLARLALAEKKMAGDIRFGFFVISPLSKTMKSTSLLAAFWLGALARGATSFAPTHHHFNNIKQKQKQVYSKQLQTSLNIRGGNIGSNMSSSSLSSVADAISATLVSGTPLRAIGGLWAISSLAVVPLTFIRQGYSFSVGYGVSVAAMVRNFPFVFVHFCTFRSSNPNSPTSSGDIFPPNNFSGVGSFVIV